MTEAKNQLRSIVERIERLTEEKKSIADDIREVFLEAKSNGYDVKALREIIKRRTWDRDKLAEHDALVETYMVALGMLADTPLGRSAVEREFDDTKVAILDGDGKKLYEGTSGDFTRAVKKLETPKGRRALREAVKQVDLEEAISEAKH